LRSGDKEDHSHAFRYQGFGKYRIEPKKKKIGAAEDLDDDDDDDTDG
jgi:hypothetical protein